MSKILKAGMIGCGDFLRWELDSIMNSEVCKVKYTYDLDVEKRMNIASKLDAQAVDNVDVIFNDPEVKIVMIFTPPWVRLDLFKKAVESGKHIITTKPLAPNAKEAQQLFDMVNGKVSCAVLYGRSGNAFVEMLKTILDSGEIGHLALYKEDWLHHYPTWNNWATDRDKNGGPFMDAMVHNLNKSRFLIGSPVKSINYFSDNFAQDLKCNDTECMKLNFENGASSYLFITWAADLEVFDPKGNDRVHYGIDQMITNKGWYITMEDDATGPIIKAVKEKEVKTWKVNPLPTTVYDDIALRIIEGREQNFDIAHALSDIKLMELASKNITQGLAVSGI